MLYVKLSLYTFFFFKQKTAYEMRISDWSSDVCSSDLMRQRNRLPVGAAREQFQRRAHGIGCQRQPRINGKHMAIELGHTQPARAVRFVILTRRNRRSEERRVGNECVSTCRSR